jgi:hypothetical protein
MRKILVSMALLAAIVILGRSNAQQFDPEMGKVMFAVGRITGETPGSLARNRSVQTELKLDDDQKNAIQEKVPAIGISFGGRGLGKGKGKGKFELDDATRERFAEYMEKIQTLKDVPEDKFEEKVRETFKDELETQAKEVEKILKPEQMTRLKQIARQQGGPLAYLKAENVKDLSITDEQKTKLRSINTELDKDRQELFRGGGGFSAETREKLEGLTKEANEKAAAVLTDEQKAKWKTLIGEPYTVPLFGARPKKDD